MLQYIVSVAGSIVFADGRVDIYQCQYMLCFLSIFGCIGSSYYGEFVETGKVVSICLVKLLPQNALVPINRGIQSGLTPTDSTRSIVAAL